MEAHFFNVRERDGDTAKENLNFLMEIHYFHTQKQFNSIKWASISKTKVF